MADPTPIERVDAALAAIERDETNAFVAVLADDARRRAVALERHGHRGPLYGVPVAVKDLFDIEGVPTTGGCAAYAGRLAQPMSPSLDCAGPMTKTVQDCADAWAVLSARPDPASFRASPPTRPDVARIGLSPTFARRVHPEIRFAIDEAARVFEAAGAEIVDVPEVQLLAGTEGFNFVWSDAALYHDGIENDDRLHPEIANLLHVGRSMTALDYARSMRDARRIRQSFRRALDHADVLLAPSTPYPAPPVTADEVEVDGGSVDVHRGGPATFTVPVNLSGLPALAFPVGWSAAGLPLGAQLIGPPWSEDLLIELGLIYERHSEPIPAAGAGSSVVRARRRPLLNHHG